MFKKILALAILLNTTVAFGAAKLQNEDFKSLSQITAAGGTAANLLNDTKVYSVQYGMQLSTAINNGLIGGGSAAGNLLVNPSFETGISSWTYGAGASAAVDTTNYIDGHQSVALTLTSVASGVTLASQTVTPGPQLAGQYLDEYIYVKTTVSGLSVCGVLAGAQYSCIAVTNDGQWHQYQSHPSYASGTVGVQLVSTATIASGTVNIDGAFSGISSGLVNVSAFSDAKPYTMVVTGTGGTNPVVPTTTTANLATWSRRGDKMLITYQLSFASNTGGVAGSGSYLFSLPPGFNVDTTKLPNPAAPGVTAIGYGFAQDGANNSAVTAVLAGGTTNQIILIGKFSGNAATASSVTSFQVGSSFGFTDANYPYELSFNVEVPILGWTSNVGAARSDQTNYGWTNGGPNLITATTTSPTKGTTSRDIVWYKRNGQNLDVRIEFVETAAGTAGSGDYLFAIPNNLSADLTLANTFTNLGAQSGIGSDLGGGSGAITNGSTSVGQNRVALYDATHVRLMFNNNASAAYMPAGSTFYQLSGTAVSYTATYSVPIAGWTETQKAPVLTGGITTNSPVAERIERVMTTACTTSPCTISKQSGSWVSSITRAGTGNYVLNISAGMFSDLPSCTCSAFSGPSSCITNTTSTTTVTVASFSSGGSSDGILNVICMGPR